MSVRKRTWKTSSGEEKSAWIVAYADADGKRHIETFKKKKDADAYADKVGVDVRAGTHTPVSQSITVAQAGEDWIKGAEVDGLERSTIAQYRQHAKHINDRIGGVKLAKLTAPRVNTLRDDLLASMSPALARKVLTSLKMLLKDAQGRGHVAQNVALSTKKIKRKKRGEKKDGGGKRQLQVGKDIPEPEEIKKIVAMLKGRWRPLFLTAIFAGLRSSELRGLRWVDIDFKTAELHVQQRADRYQQIGDPKSETSARSVPLGPVVLNALREWKLKCPKGEDNKLGLAFPTEQGCRTKDDRRGEKGGGNIDRHINMVRVFKSAVRRAGLVVPDIDTKTKEPKLNKRRKPIMKSKYTGLHALRHFYASWCINPPERGGLGLPPKVVQEQLGHSTLAMTMDTYGHLFPRDDDAKQRLADAERAFFADAT